MTEFPGQRGGRELPRDLQGDYNHLAKMYALLAAVNQVVILSKSEADVYERICEAMVADPDILLAWVGLRPPGSDAIEVVSAAGPSASYVDGLTLTVDPQEVLGRGPTATCLREGTIQQTVDWTRPPEPFPWLPKGLAQGFRSSMALPLQRFGATFGVLTIYSSQPNYFQAELLELFRTMAENLRLAFEGLEEARLRRVSERALEDRERAIHTMLQSSQDAVWLIDRDLQLMEVNDAACRMLGFTRDEMVGASILKFVVSAPYSHRERTERLRERGHMRFDATHRRKDGTLLEVEASTTYQPESGLFVSYIRDLSPRKAAEKALLDSQSQAVAIFRCAPDPMGLLDAETFRFLEVNDAFSQTYGYSREELLTMTPIDLSAEPEITRRSMQVREMRVPIRWHRRKDGTRLPVDLRVGISELNQRKVMAVSYRDISDRVRATARAEARISNLQALLDLAASSRMLSETELLRRGLEIAVNLSESRVGCLYLVDRERGCLASGIWSSEALREGLGPPSGEAPVVATGIWSEALRRGAPVIRNETQDAVVDLEGGLSLNRTLVIPLFTDGKPSLLLRVGGRELPYEEEDATFLQLVASDLWQLVLRHRVEAELQEANRDLEANVRRRTKELQRSNEDLESFAYSVSHDLRAPLRQTEGFLRLLALHLDEGLDETARHYMETSVGATRRMGRLIDDLLSFSRMGRAPLRNLPLDLPSMVQSALVPFEEDTRTRGIRWDVGELPPMEGDPALMAVALENLLSNAVKFTRPQKAPRIHIEGVTDLPGEVGFRVRDNGAGFDPRYADQIFGVFQRLHSEQAFEGTGIGLATVHRIIQRHGGRVLAEGAEGQGAAFTVLLPRVGAP